MINRIYINESAQKHVRVNGLNAAEIRILFHRKMNTADISEYAAEKNNNGSRKVFTVNAAKQI